MQATYRHPRVHSFEQWRAAARVLLLRQVAPHAVQWLAPGGDGDLLALAGAAPTPVPAGSAGLRISRTLMDLLQTAACCRMPDRWAFLYRVLWRWQQGERQVLSALDADGARLQAMVRAVRRAERAMLASLRFRERRAQAGAPRFLAWCESGHEVLPQVARHFAIRLRRVTWMIATPEAGVVWDGAALHSTGPLLPGPGAPAWPPYYRAIFMPARLGRELLPSAG